MDNEILVGIVTCNPDIERLKLNILAVKNQAVYVAIIDNDSNNIDEIKKLINSFEEIILVQNEENKGVAYALNQIGDIALKRQFKAFLTLDQDSIISEGMLSKLYSSFTEDNIGIIAPYINRDSTFISENKVISVPTVITSGSLTSTDAWATVGGYWDFLFIDEVDHEFCYALRKKGYKILMDYSTCIDHIIGTPFSKKVFGHVFHPTNHSAFRRYYMARNSILMIYLYPNEKYPFKNRYVLLFKIMVSILICEKQKMKKIQAIIKGVIDGIAIILKNDQIKLRKQLKQTRK